MKALQIKNSIALAPMEDVTCRAFRIVCKRLGADRVYTEFTSSEALIRDAKRALDKIQFEEEERPIGIQIYGAIADSMENAAKISERYHPDFIDINCGCWVKNHAMRFEGAGLLRDLNRFEAIVKATVRATRLPVTVKTRLGWDHNDIVILDVAKIVEQAGAQALTVHCRTRCQGYKGNADWQWLEKLKKTVNIPVIGNGDIKTPQDVKRMFDTGCDGVMIGRGALANPWIFKQSKHYLKTGQLLPEPMIEEKVAVCIDHLKLNVKYRGLHHGIVTFRKYYAGYLSGLPHVAKLRSDLMELLTLNSIVDRLMQFVEERKTLAMDPA